MSKVVPTTEGTKTAHASAPHRIGAPSHPGVPMTTTARAAKIAAPKLCMLAVVFIGTPRWDGAPILWGALAWAVLVPSVVGTTLLMWMMRHGEATRVTALLLLVPPLAAVHADLLLRQTLTPLQLLRVALALRWLL